MPRASTAAAARPAVRDPADRVVRFFATRTRHVKDRWAGEPFTLEPWQENDIIRPLFGTVGKDGFRRYREALIGMPRKNGKALDVDTPILTPAGFVRMGDLQPGDIVYGPNGRPVRVSLTSPVMLGARCYRVRFASGDEIIADEGHLWTVRQRDKVGERIVTTGTLAESFRVVRSDGGVERRFAVRVAKPVDLPGVAPLPMPPYLLGCWLGDGTSLKAEITTADPEIVAAFAARYPLTYDYRKGEAHTRGIRGGFLLSLRALGVLGNKHVPSSYLFAPRSDRLELLRGLLDTDGCVNRGSARQPFAPRVEYTSTSRPLADAALYLARSLGWKATLREGVATLNGREIGAKYRVSWTAYRGLDAPFRLARKRDRLAAPPASPTRASSNAIVEVTEVASRPVRCITIDDPSGVFLAGRGLIPTHNSQLAAGLGLYGLFADGHYDPKTGLWIPQIGAEVYVVAGSKLQARIIFDTARSMVLADPMLRTMAGVYKDAIEVPETNSVFRVLAADAKLAHGYNPSLAIIDELWVHPNDELYEAMSTGTAARQQPLLVSITTAGYDRNSFLWKVYDKTRKGGNRGRFFFYWRAAPKDCAPTDMRAFKQANPASWITTKYLRDQQKKPSMTEFGFRRLHGNQWTSSSEAVVPMAKWDACKGKPKFPKGSEVILSVDVAPRGHDRTALLLSRKDEDGRYHVHNRIFEVDPDVGIVSYDDIEDAIREYCRTFDVREVAFDPYYFDSNALTLLNEGIPMVQFPQNDSRMVPASMGCYTAILERRIVHDGDKVLRDHVENGGAREGARGWRFDKRKSSGRIDGLICLTMAIDRWERGDDGYDEPSVFLGG